MATDGRDIEAAVKLFIGHMAARCAGLHASDPMFPADVTLVMSPNKVSIKRTPTEQAEEVQKGKSWTCRSSHMTDNARHVILKIGKESSYGLSEAKALKKHTKEFKNVWREAMKVAQIKNFHGTDGYADGDEFHLELPETKLPPNDKRVIACYDHYVTLTRKKGKAKNDDFENGKADVKGHRKGREAPWTTRGRGRLTSPRRVAYNARNAAATASPSRACAPSS
jgi:hypothetical protein